MMKYLFAAAATFAAMPAQANILKNCYSLLGPDVYVSNDKAKLEADIACFKAAKWQIDISIAARQMRLDQLAPPKKPTTGRSVVVAEGDSISMFWNGSYTGIYALRHPNIDVRGAAVSGSRISDPLGGNGLVQRRANDLAANAEVVTVLIGANDLGDGNYATPQDWLTALWGYVASLKTAGAKVAVGTVLPICLPKWPEYTQRHNARRAIVNAAIRDAVANRTIDTVIDFGADPVMGPDAAACDAALYKDGIHPSDGDTKLVGGSGKMAALYEKVVDKLLKE